VAAYGVVITPDGEVESFVKLEHLLKRKNSYNEKERKAKMSDLDRLKDFIQVPIYLHLHFCRNALRASVCP
jgi:hypothetical protein